MVVYAHILTSAVNPCTWPSIHAWADALCVKYLVSFFPHGSVCGQFHFLFFWQKCPSSFFHFFVLFLISSFGNLPP